MVGLGVCVCCAFSPSLVCSSLGAGLAGGGSFWTHLQLFSSFVLMHLQLISSSVTLLFKPGSPAILRQIVLFATR